MENYINSIFEKQTENEIKDLLYSFCSETGENKYSIDEAILQADKFTIIDSWGCKRYNRLGIKTMLEYIINNY